MTRIGQGNFGDLSIGQAAFDEKLFETVSKARPAILYLTGNAEDANDLIQTTYYKLLLRHRHFGLTPSENYAKKTARNLFYSAKRRQKVQVRSETTHARSTESGATKRKTDTILDSLVRTSDCLLVDAAFALLTPKDQEVLQLYYFDGLKRSGVAKRLGLSCRGATSRRDRAIKKLTAAFLAVAIGDQKARHRPITPSGKKLGRDQQN